MTTRTRRTRVAPAEPPTDAPPSDEQILEQFHRQATAVLDAFAEAKAQFLEKFDADPAETLLWRGGPLVSLQYEAGVWDEARRFVASSHRPPSTLGLFIELRDHAQAQMDDIVRSHRWEHSSTNAMSNLVKLERLSGEARAQHAIRDFARWAVREIEKRKAPIEEV